MSKRDYYEILGCDKKADGDTLKKAFRKLAMQYHPDRNPGNQEAEVKFKEINEAYDVLRDDNKRAAYDRYGHAAFDGSAGGRSSGFDFGGFSDIFEEMFGDLMGGGGGRGRGAGPSRGADLRYNLEINLEEAFRGEKKRIRVTTSAACDTCKGTGAATGSQPATCPGCAGQGKVRVQQGFFAIERTCPSCHGAGQVIKDPCRSCNGQGRVRQEKNLEVNIPPGVEDGTRIRLAGEGEAGMRGSHPGDLYVFLSVSQHPLFRRDGPNIECRVPIPMTTAALGGSVEVPAIDGEIVPVKIPAGTQTGTQFRLRGKGMSVLRSPTRGDMYVTAFIETPMSLTPRQRELLEEFAGEAGLSAHTHPESAGFFDKVKNLFG